VRVRDDGPGVTDEDAERLFGLYYRSALQASTAPGAGIGLFVCRELVAAMGGRIWAKSLPDKGAEFGFSVQAYVDDLDMPAEALSAVSGNATSANGAGASTPAGAAKKPAAPTEHQPAVA
jgi:hypothetical protein